MMLRKEKPLARAGPWCNRDRPSLVRPECIVCCIEMITGLCRLPLGRPECDVSLGGPSAFPAPSRQTWNSQKKH
eukprot:547794-Pyramimonas_sp.AAC.1